MMAEDLASGTYGSICKLVPFRTLECKVEQLTVFAKNPLEVTVRAAGSKKATFLYSWRLGADDVGFPHYVAEAVAIICPPDMLMKIYEMAKEEAKKELIA